MNASDSKAVKVDLRTVMTAKRAETLGKSLALARKVRSAKATKKKEEKERMRLIAKNLKQQSMIRAKMEKLAQALEDVQRQGALNDVSHDELINKEP
jgi:hypothetical protein